MPAGVVSRVDEARAVAGFLAAAAAGPAALIIRGEAGIGKTTLWVDGVAQAGARGFEVLSARPSAAESVLAYAGLADLLGGLDENTAIMLPDPQRRAVDRVLLRASQSGDDDRGRPADQRAVAAGFVSILEGLATKTPVLVAIDDLQWLDPSSRQVVAFAVRRLTGRVGLLGAVRTDSDRGDGASWLQLPPAAPVTRIRVAPLNLGGVHAIITQRLGRPFSRPTLVRIQEISAGNPFYALELARAIDEEGLADNGVLPGTLAELVRARIGRLDPAAGEVLLAAACAAPPTVELVAQATGCDAAHVVELLADAETAGIIEIDGHRLRFTHPLLAHGMYSDATPARRRGMHQRLAGIVEEPELRARHLALAATTAEPSTLRSLDVAAESARRRGAPAAAAELIGLAIGLGGDTPQRRIAVAGHHLAAGDIERARQLLEDTIAGSAPGPLRAEASSLLGFVHLFGNSFTDAAGVLERALDEAGDDVALRTRLLTTLSYARYNAGRFGAATASIEDAVTHAERLGQPHPLSQALSMRIVLRFLRGDGLDAAELARALELEDAHASMPMAFRPSMQNAMLAAWTGHLDEAHRELTSIRRRCIEHGEENELIFVAVHAVLCEIWRGNLADVALIAEDTMERALQLGGDVPLFVSLTMRATLAAYAGRVDDARCDIGEALAASGRCGANLLVVWPITTLGFLEVSLGNHQAALTAVEPLRRALDVAPNATEIVFASFIPDAVEAMIGLGLLADAEPLIERLERNGVRLDRAWMLALGARCRALLLAAGGDLDAAHLAAQRAMAQHERLPMPFEQARTQLLLGQLQRRRRLTDAAATSVRAALATFNALGIPLWADRARAELARANVGHRRTAELTPSERRVAELAALGMTNRDVAATLFVSPKTVEATLARVYRKMDIHSRAELGRRIAEYHQG